MGDTPVRKGLSVSCITFSEFVATSFRSELGPEDQMQSPLRCAPESPKRLKSPTENDLAGAIRYQLICQIRTKVFSFLPRFCLSGYSTEALFS
jgi:hypothetical protein